MDEERRKRLSGGFKRYHTSLESREAQLLEQCREALERTSQITQNHTLSTLQMSNSTTFGFILLQFFQNKIRQALGELQSLVYQTGCRNPDRKLFSLR